MTVRIITDSGSDYLEGMHPALRVLPLGIAFGTSTYLDGVDLTRQGFYEKLIEEEGLPTTSQVTPGAYHVAFEEVAQAGDEAVVIALSSRLSGTCASAQETAKEFDCIHVVDSLNVTVGQNVLVAHALDLVDQGLNASQIASRLEDAKGRVRLVALLDTLEYLKRGGRIGAAASAIGELLSIKPVIGIEEGAVAMLGKARGSKNGRNILREQVKNGGIDFAMPVCLGYTGLSDKLLEKYLEDSSELWEGLIERGDLMVAHVGAAVGTHIGPGAIAVAFFAQA